MKVSVYVDDDFELEIECEVIPRLGDYMMLEGTEHFVEDDTMGSYLIVVQVLHHVKDGIVKEISVWLEDVGKENGPHAYLNLEYHLNKTLNKLFTRYP